ncbi:hypothetical protein AXF42_Ash005957 [Apostasia shenzhenica]|uniref:Uncharacterized protein n=1 Tax=Apostasia shenzhenica TaxID=1088818 RepID=A0A2I0AZU5_9ASPA|nr:hypothetical protein AXF42_Ash005957 [Apostasia shenzhenica]
MDSSSSYFVKLPSVTASLSLLLLLAFLLLTTCSTKSSLSLSSFTLLVLALSSSLPFIIPKLKSLLSLDSWLTQEVQIKTSESPRNHQNLQLPSASNPLVSGDESSPEKLQDGIEEPISDDESLIEIALPDGHFVVPETISSSLSHEHNCCRDEEGIRGCSPESLRHGLIGLLSEIMEEDNMIEIDISMGSIKCPRLEIRA